MPDQVAEIRSPEFLDERLLVSRNPRLQQERARKREELLQSTEQFLEQAAAKVRRGRKPWQSAAAIQRRLGRELNRHKMEKHFVYSAEHVRGHVFLCMLAYYLEWHLRRQLAPLLFEDSERDAATAQRDAATQPAQVSSAAKAKAASKRTPHGLPVQSLRTLLEHLGAQALNYVTLAEDDKYEFPLVAQPTALQAEAFALLGVDPDKIVSSKMAS